MPFTYSHMASLRRRYDGRARIRSGRGAQMHMGQIVLAQSGERSGGVAASGGAHVSGPRQIAGYFHAAGRRYLGRPLYGRRQFMRYLVVFDDGAVVVSVYRDSGGRPVGYIVGLRRYAPERDPVFSAAGEQTQHLFSYRDGAMFSGRRLHDAQHTGHILAAHDAHPAGLRHRLHDARNDQSVYQPVQFPYLRLHGVAPNGSTTSNTSSMISCSTGVGPGVSMAVTGYSAASM